MYSFNQLTQPTGNIYLSIRVVGLRADQLLAQESAAFQEALEKQVEIQQQEQHLLPILPTPKTAQLELAKRYEAHRKPVLRAMDDLVAGKLMWVSRTGTTQA